MASPSLAAASFVALCKSEKIKIPPNTAEQRKYLTAAGHDNPSLLRTNRDWRERAASLAWARSSLSKAENPDAWPTDVNPAILPTLLSLYALPPHRGPAPAPSDFVRLAAQIALFDPSPPVVASAAPSAAAPLAAAAAAAVAGGGGSAASGGSTAPPPGGGSAGATASSIDLAEALPTGNPKKRPIYLSSRLLMDMLPAAVFDSMDASHHMDVPTRAKYQKAIDEGCLENRLDLAVAAPFGYQVSLVHSRPSPWNAALRGQALALAGRYAHTGPNGDPDSDDMLAEETQRYPCRLRFQAQWNDMLPTWNSPHEISVSQVGVLWQAVSWHLRKRASNAVHWHCPEVLAGCRRQCAELKVYPAAVTSAIMRDTRSLTSPADQRRAHNKAMLAFFLPFWYENILERNGRDAAEAEAEVASIMGE